MPNFQEVLVSASDAETLGEVIEQCRRSRPGDGPAVKELSELLMQAELVPDEHLPGDRVSLHSKVTYEEQPGGTRRTVEIVYPEENAPGEGRISVLSPIGRALLGRKPGNEVQPEAPGARSLTLRILESRKD